ncbi:thymopoietin b isoform X1 [Xiphias gladius]|uniref:thymopoietin b isoform X1 n=1 Tax=Xiphias gladius TaxID=8245 RepID=UPI001A98B62E|nr:thymopoietin b isoform X1 [Xiphias gladius]
MAEFLDDPSVLTKDKLKNELAANNVPLPSGEHKKEVYVQLYLKNLTVLNNKKSPPADTFSSDEELPAPVVSNKSRSGRKATKKTDKPRTEDMDVTDLTDEDLKQQLAKHGVDSGPIVASTRKLYEKKLQKLLDQPPAEPEAPTDVTALPKADSNQNGNTNSDQYSDKEDEEIAAPEPEPVPVVEKSVRSRGKAPVTVRTSSRRQTKVVEEIIIEETPKKASESVVEDILANEISTPTGISATCRRPIRGAAGRPVKPTPSLQAKPQLDEASCPCCSSSCSLLWWAVLSTTPSRTWMRIRSTPSKASWTASLSHSRALWTSQPPTWASAAAVLQTAQASKDPQQSLAIPTPPPCRLPQHTTTQAENWAHLSSFPTW